MPGEVPDDKTAKVLMSFCTNGVIPESKVAPARFGPPKATITTRPASAPG